MNRSKCSCAVGWIGGAIVQKIILTSILTSMMLISCAPSSPLAGTPIPLVVSKTPTPRMWGIPYSSKAMEISFMIPEGWYVVEKDSGILLTSNHALVIEDHLSFTEGQAIIILKKYTNEENDLFMVSTMLDILNNLPPYLPPGKEPAHFTTFNGRDLVVAGYGINKPIPHPSFTAMIAFENRAILGLIFTSLKNERSFRIMFLNVISSVDFTDIP